MRQMEDETHAYQERYNQNEDEFASIKEEMQVVLNYKNDLELLINEQAQILSMATKRSNQIED